MPAHTRRPGWGPDPTPGEAPGRHDPSPAPAATPVRARAGQRGPTLRRPEDLARAGLIAADRVPALEAVAARYAVAITPAMAELIDPVAENDPIARQFVPDVAELNIRPEELADPIGDDVHAVAPGLIHRYPDRVLLKLAQVCAVYCRFCFRRENVGPDAASLPPAALAAALDYIAAHAEIWEVIVSGGDPLVASPRRLAELMKALGGIGHVRVARFHTRVPVVTPERVTDDLVAALKADGVTTWVAIHANHPRELTAAARTALARLADAGIPLVSQTVLLAGVNDDAETLGALMRGFVECRVKPYYLHHGDLAPGTGHFRTTIDKGQALMRALRGHYSGLCQPSYVLDIPGGHGKVPVGPCYRHDDRIDDWQGGRHAYRDAPTET
ncbi:MAG: lysine-2,3-aminomutase-like protein [Bauldia sp.]|nr:lysine-2,3-aminomutase-like protein [Bauldia sp.]